MATTGLALTPIGQKALLDSPERFTQLQIRMLALLFGGPRTLSELIDETKAQNTSYRYIRDRDFIEPIAGWLQDGLLKEVQVIQHIVEVDDPRPQQQQSRRAPIRKRSDHVGKIPAKEGSYLCQACHRTFNDSRTFGPLYCPFCGAGWYSEEAK